MTKILFLLVAFVSVSCTSLDNNFYEARRRCTSIMYEKGINVKKGASTLKNKTYTDCVTQTANAKANVSQANATWASVITLWITAGLSVLVNITNRR